MKIFKLLLTASRLGDRRLARRRRVARGLMRRVATYKPMAGFNHVVGGERFVGYFLAGPDRCDVTVFQARADDEALATPAAPLRACRSPPAAAAKSTPARIPRSPSPAPPTPTRSRSRRRSAASMRRGL